MKMRIIIQIAILLQQLMTFLYWMGKLMMHKIKLNIYNLQLLKLMDCLINLRVKPYIIKNQLKLNL